MAVEKKVCPECRVSIKEANYEKHLSRVHNKTLEEIEGPRPRGEVGSKAKMLAVVVAVVIVISLFAYFVVFMGDVPVGDGDYDGDGIPDRWEADHGLDHTDPSDAALDSDGDGLTNLVEFNEGSNPRITDSDSDGMPDKFEYDNGLRLNDGWDATQDFDFDGVTNADEYEAGTNIYSEIHATFRVEGYTDIVVELFPEKAPISVGNFIRYAEDGYYVATIFHRVVDDFMIQGGWQDSTGGYKNPTYPDIPLERTSQTGLTHKDGALSMARRTEPDSASAQFFICDKDNAYRLDAENAGGDGYAVFGYTISGMETVRALAAVPTVPGSNNGEDSAPVETILLNGVDLAWTD